MSEEEYISRADLDIQVMTGDDEEKPCVYVKFSGFDDLEEADEYADQLLETLPLLLFESTQVH
jgi:hypothetical protein